MHQQNEYKIALLGRQNSLFRQDYNHETLTGETEHGVKTTLASTDHEYKL